MEDEGETRSGALRRFNAATRIRDRFATMVRAPMRFIESALARGLMRDEGPLARALAKRYQRREMPR